MEPSIYTLLGVSKAGLAAIWGGLTTGVWIFTAAFALGLTLRLAWLVADFLVNELKGKSAPQLVAASHRKSGAQFEECA